MKKMAFQYDTETMEFAVIKSKRKSLSIAIQPDGNLLVKAPLFMSDGEILKWVKTKTGWIVRQRAKVLEQQESNLPKKYVTGETFLYLGKKYTLEVRISEGRSKMVGIVDDKIILFSKTDDESAVQKILTDWYVKQAKAWIVKHVHIYANQMGEAFNGITIKNQKKRWGSCSSARNLNFNWRLMMAPPEVIDYVVVHELCHLKQMNHSKEFWHEVEKVLPDYKVRKRWLDENGRYLNL